MTLSSNTVCFDFSPRGDLKIIKLTLTTEKFYGNSNSGQSSGGGSSNNMGAAAAMQVCSNLPSVSALSKV